MKHKMQKNVLALFLGLHLLLSAALPVFASEGADAAVPSAPLGQADFEKCDVGAGANLKKTLAGAPAGYSVLSEQLGGRSNRFLRQPMSVKGARTTLATTGSTDPRFPKIEIAADFRYSAKTVADGEGQWNLQLVDRSSGSAKFWSLIRFKAYNGAVILDGTTGGNVFTSAVTVPGEWFRIRLAVDTSNGNVTLYYNDEFVTTVKTAGHNGFLVDQNSAIITVNAVSSATTLDVDNFSMRYIPSSCTVTIDGSEKAVGYGETVSLVAEGKQLAYAKVSAFGKTEYQSSGTLRVFYDTVVETAQLSLQTLRGASVRVATESGIRFVTQVSRADFDALNKDPKILRIRIGTLISPTEQVGIASFRFTKEAMDATRLATEGLAVPYVEVNASVGAWYEEDSAYYRFAGSLVRLKDNFREISGVGYVELTMDDGSIQTIYGGYSQKDHSRSVAYVASRALSDPAQGWNAAEEQLLKDFAKDYVDIDAVYGGKEGTPLYGLNVMAIGDSLFAGHKTGKEFVWLQQLADRYQWKLWNYGVNGSSVSNHNDGGNYPNGKWAMVDRYLQMDTTNAAAIDLVFVECGFNDFQIQAPVGVPGNTDTTTFLGAVKVLIDGLCARYPNAKIVLVTPWNLSNGLLTIDGVSYNYGQYTGTLRNLYRDIYAGNDRVQMIDAGDPAISGIDMDNDAFRNLWSYLPGDRFHLNAGGMYRMANFMRHEIYKLFR